MPVELSAFERKVLTYIEQSPKTTKQLVGYLNHEETWEGLEKALVKLRQAELVLCTNGRWWKRTKVAPRWGG